MIKAIYFDVGHTLVNLYGADKSELFKNQYHNCYGPSSKADLLRKATIVSEIFHQKNCLMELTDREEFWIRYYQAGLGAMNYSKSDSYRKAKEIYSFENPKKSLTLIEGVIPMLNDLKKKGYYLGVISNWNSNLEKDLAALNIDKYFDTIISSESVGVEKPNTKIFLEALGQFSPDETLMVGDLYYFDVLPALSIGMEAVLFDSVGCLNDIFGVRSMQKIEQLIDFLR